MTSSYSKNPSKKVLEVDREATMDKKIGLGHSSRETKTWNFMACASFSVGLIIGKEIFYRESLLKTKNNDCKNGKEVLKSFAMLMSFMTLLCFWNHFLSIILASFLIWRVITWMQSAFMNYHEIQLRLSFKNM